MELIFLWYTLEGLIIVIPNMFYFIATVRTYRLREKYGLIGMEFFADGIMGVAVALAGGMRFIKSCFSDLQEALISRRICMVVPYNVIMAWSDPMTAISMLMVSIDRLISIVQPVKYYKNVAKIQKFLALYSNLSMVPLILASAVCSFQNNIVLHGVCWTPLSRCPIFNQIYYGIRVAAAGISVMLHVITLFAVRRYIKRKRKSQNLASAAAEDKRQLRFTKTAGFSCFATVGLYVMPMVVTFFETGRETLPEGVYKAMTLLSNLNSIPKIIIVGWRSPDIRQAVFDLMPNWFGMRKQPSINAVACNTLNTQKSVNEGGAVSTRRITVHD